MDECCHLLNGYALQRRFTAFMIHLFIARQHAAQQCCDIDMGILSACLSRSGIISKWFNITSYFLKHIVIVAQFIHIHIILLIPSSKHLCEIRTGSPPMGALNTGGVHKCRDF